MNEEWRDVPGFEGLYKISSFGNLMTERRQGTKGGIAKCYDGGKYISYPLCKGGKYYPSQIHRLVALAFIPNPQNLPCVNHKDENPKNNRADNLEWCSYSYNNNYGTARERSAKSRWKPCIGTWPDGSTKTYNSCTLASKDTGISQGNIWGACNGLWRHAGGVEWKYLEEAEAPNA